jgi:predicted nucleotidyltransferase
MKFIKVKKSREGKPIDFNEIEPEIEKLAEKFKLKLIYIYGSYAFNNAGKLSDVDIAILGENKLNLDKKLKLLEALQEIFEEEAVDLVELSKVPLTLIHRILKEGKCIFTSDLATKIDFEVRNEHLYYDTQPLRKEYFEGLKKRIKDGTFGSR